MEPETWVEIEGFEDYLISTSGNVKNHQGRLLSLRVNAQDITMVGLSQDGKQHMRAVDLLVAHAFLEPPQFSAFTSVIHLNGVRSDNHVNNLMWRPRWFAVKYHRQFKEDLFNDWNAPIYIMDTDEVFNNPREIAVKYGVLERSVHEAVVNHSQVWPYGWDLRYAR